MTEPAPTYFTQCVSTRCVGGVFYHCVKELGHHFEPSDLCENPDIGQWSFTWITPPETRKTVEVVDELPSHYWGPSQFWSHVAISEPDQCWLWKNGLDRKGYGSLQMGGRPTNGGKNYRAHRVAWEMANGPLPEGAWVLHRCDNRQCCNPSHLFLGDALSNVQDMDAKGRRITVTKKGEEHWNSKLADIEVAGIRSLLDILPRKQIAEMYGVKKVTVDAIAANRLHKKTASVAYIAGRMTGMKDWNFPAFHKAAAKLRDAGYEVINPAEEFGGATDLPRQVYMHKAMENVLRADVIFTLKGWDYSEGAALEVTVARAVGKEVKKLGRG